jgi:hypothetical protein
MKKLVIAGTLVGVLACIGVGVAYAQGNQLSSGTHGRPGHGPRGDARDGAFHGLLLESFADALQMPVAELREKLAAGVSLREVAAEMGLDDEEFRDMMEKVHAAALEKAVEEGLMTQEQADRLQDSLPPWGPLTDADAPPRGALKEIMDHALLRAAAEALNIPTEELSSRLAEGERLGQVARAEGLDVEEWHAILVAARQAAAQAALEQGLITEEQALRWQEGWPNLERGKPGPGTCGDEPHRMGRGARLSR